MNIDNFETRVSVNLGKHLAAIGEQQQIMIALFKEIRADQHAIDALRATVEQLQENDAELKRLILEQGGQIRALRERLDDGGGAS